MSVRNLLATVRSPLWAHVTPFVVWLLFLQLLGEPAGWKYALRAAVCLALFCYLRPWQYYGRLHLSNVPLALAVGVGVFAIWVVFETPWLAQGLPSLHNVYLTVAVLPPWSMGTMESSSVYAPEANGWLFTITRLLGAAFAISAIEEFFWRGFLYRWAIDNDFLTVDLGRWSPTRFAFVAVLFGLEHQRWLVGVIAGVAYGAFTIKTKDVWATSLAHATTNLLLGFYVILADQYQFWG